MLREQRHHTSGREFFCVDVEQTPDVYTNVREVIKPHPSTTDTNFSNNFIQPKDTASNSLLPENYSLSASFLGCKILQAKLLLLLVVKP